MIRLYIENLELDVLDNFTHQITYAVDDLNNLDSKTTAFSKTITIPGTGNNNRLLGNIFEFANSNFAGEFTGEGANVNYNFNASKAAKCRLDYNDVTIIKGVLRLLEIVVDNGSVEYQIAIFGELGGLFAKLGNKKIDELDFSAYNHEYRETNFRIGNDAGFYGFVTGNDTAIVNSTESFCAMQGVDYSQYFDGATSISIKDFSTGTNYGTHTIDRYEWDGNTFTVYITDTFTSPPGSTFIAQIQLNGSKGFGYYYPLIDYGNYSTDKHDYKFRTFRPAFHLKEYIDKIIKGAGYTYESKFFKSDFFNRLIIPNNQSKLLTLRSDLFYGKINDAKTVQENTDSLLYNDKIIINRIIGEAFTTTDNKEFTYIGDNTTNAKFELSFVPYIVPALALRPGHTFDIAFDLLLNNLSINRIVFTFLIDNSTTYYPDVDLNTEYNLNTNDIVSIEVTISCNLPTSDIQTYLIYFFNTYGFKIKSQYPVVAPVEYGDLLEVNKSLPKNILQKDLFASVLKMFYLMVQEDKYRSKHLIIDPWTWFFNLNRNTYIDWSDKLDRSQPIKIKPMSEANARYYDIKYKSDNDYFNEFYRKKYAEGYGDVRFDNQLDFAKDAESVEVIFSSTPLIGYAEEDKITPAIFKWDGKEKGVKEENVNSNIRIMQKKAIADVAEWEILDDSGNPLASYTDYNYAGHFDDPDVPGSDINFGATKELFFTLAAGALGNNLFNTFYSSYLAEITDKDSRLVTAKFKLSDVDIFNLDFGKFIWIDGVLYRLQRIIDYSPNEICQVELLRVINTTYDNTVNAGEYSEILIDGIVWQTRNFDGMFYRNGDPITQLTSDDQILGEDEGAWCYYNYRTANGSVWGILYNWYAINDSRGIAPDGWRVPNFSELKSIQDAASNIGHKLKEEGNTYWNTANGTNQFGFSARGGGQKVGIIGSFRELKEFAYFWSSTSATSSNAKYLSIQDTETAIFTGDVDKNRFFSLRLIKDI